jgi:hypothetical protein
VQNIDLFVGNFIDSDTTNLPKGISLAGNYYQQKIRLILNIKYSITVYYKERRFDYKSNHNLQYVGLRRGYILYNVIIIINSIIRLTNKKNIKTVIFYNIDCYNLLYFIYLKLFGKTNIVVILADAGFLLSNKILNRILSKALSFANGILALREIAKLHEYKLLIEIMPGIIIHEELYPESRKITNTVFMSGSLGETTGLFLALDYFSSQSVFKLVMTGNPYLISQNEFDILLSKYKCDKIEYRGVLKYEEYIKVLSSCEYGLSLRNPKDIEHQNNFPSKILEYMSYGNIVVSSLTYPELPNDTYYTTEFTLEGLQKSFDNILKSTKSEREFFSKNAKYLIEQKFSEKVFKSKINNLIRKY